MAMIIKTTVPITDERINDLFDTAHEGGINYWCGPSTCCTIEELRSGAAATYHDIEDRDNRFELTFEMVEAGLQLMSEKYHNQFMNIVDENFDAETADIFIQYCLFKEVVYG